MRPISPCPVLPMATNGFLNGEKIWISGAGDPRCKIMIVMVQYQPGWHRAMHSHIQVLVPFETPGVQEPAPHGNL